MSLVLNMVGGGGGGGLQDTDALLRVQAPAGSVVTITKGGMTKTDHGHENADDNSVYDYYFIIHQSQFDSVNPWTVTATLGGDSLSDTVVIDAPDEYDVRFVFNLWLFKDGNQCVSVTGGWTQDGWGAMSGSATIEDGLIKLVGGNNLLLATALKIDVTNYSSITFKGTKVSAYQNGTCIQDTGLYSAKQPNNASIMGPNFTTLNGTGIIDQTLDLSNVTGEWYIVCRVGNSRTCIAHFSEVYLTHNP